MPDFFDGSDPPLSPGDRLLLLRLARWALIDHFERGGLPAIDSASPALLRPRATFVTLRRRDSGALRGCKGESKARRPLAEAVVRQAISSAVDDPRFEPVTPDEVPALAIQISVLTPMRPIRPEQIVLGRHGLMIARGTRAGLLLPQVPAHHGFDREEFLDALCRKAGLPRRAYLDDAEVRLFSFEAEVWGEAELGPADSRRPS